MTVTRIFLLTCPLHAIPAATSFKPDWFSSVPLTLNQDTERAVIKYRGEIANCSFHHCYLAGMFINKPFILIFLENKFHITHTAHTSYGQNQKPFWLQLSQTEVKELTANWVVAGSFKEDRQLLEQHPLTAQDHMKNISSLSSVMLIWYRFMAQTLQSSPYTRAILSYSSLTSWPKFTQFLLKF